MKAFILFLFLTTGLLFGGDIRLAWTAEKTSVAEYHVYKKNEHNLWYLVTSTIKHEYIEEDAKEGRHEFCITYTDLFHTEIPYGIPIIFEIINGKTYIIIEID
jgi:hypothetical protein